MRWLDVPRLRNKAGSVVNVDDALAEKLTGFEPVKDEGKKPASKGKDDKK